MRSLVAASMLFWLAGWPAGAAEKMVTEVITAGYRSADELVAVIRPLVPPPGSVSSLYDQLVIRTTPENLHEIRRLLQSLDRAPANLLISVKHVADEEVRRDLAEAAIIARSGEVSVSAGRPVTAQRGLSAQVGDGSSSAAVNVTSSESRRGSTDVQTVRVLEGKEAFIASGTAVPLGHQTTIVQHGQVVVQRGVTYAEANSGFYVRPRLTANGVSLDIFPSDNRFRGDNIETREIATTVSGPLGRWMEIGGSSTTSRSARSQIGHSSGRELTADHSVYVKVDRLPDR